jgi:hypothetical protein
MTGSTLRSGQLKQKVMKEGVSLVASLLAGMMIKHTPLYKALDRNLIQPNFPPIEETIPVLRIPDALGTEGNVALLEESFRGAAHAKEVQKAVESLPFDNGVEFHSVHQQEPYKFKTFSLENMFKNRSQSMDTLVKRLGTINPQQTKAHAVNISMGGNWVAPQIAMLKSVLPESPLPQSDEFVRNNPELFYINPVTSLAELYPQQVFETSKVFIKENKGALQKSESHMAQKVAELRKHNIPVFVASGNSNKGIKAYEKLLLGGTSIPEYMIKNQLHVPGVISVGASKADGTLKPYSTHYKGVRYTAPMPKGSKEEGTSLSTPQVAAAGAYLIDEKHYTVDEMLNYLDGIGKPMKTTVNGVTYPYTFLPFDRQMISDLKNAPKR